MNDEKWNTVLVEWVNCLKLSKSISSIDELKNGQFFSNLQKIITKSRNAQLDLLTFIFDLLAKHYPNITFDDKTEIHLTDLPATDLKTVTSLLMHYTCMYDRKDVLTSPLCHSLSQTTQLIIRNFLQKIATETTNSTMNEIIQSCINDASDHLTNHHWLSQESTRNSPLQELLKTPVSKFGRLYEKDKVISKLKSELESERYDKTELQEELKVQQEKSKRIEQQLLQKNSEISRLRAEVASLESRTPPHYQDMDSRELQRRLRSEIQSLEQYIKQIENEQDEVRREKDCLVEQLRKVEEQSNIWEEKFLETERHFENLNEHKKKQEEELKELQAHCSEITALLEEYKSKPSNDNSLYDTFTSIGNEKSLNETPPCEDLACSVVEVQLRDAQKQNDELMVKIQDFEKNEVHLKNAIAEMEKKLKTSESFTGELDFQIKNLETNKEKMETQLLEVENDLVKTRQKILKLTDEVQHITKELQEKSQGLQQVSKENKELVSQVQLLQSHNNNLEQQITEISKKYEEEKKRSHVLDNELDDATTVSKKLQFELADAILNNEQLTLQQGSLKVENELFIKDLKETENIRIDLETRLNESIQVVGQLRVKCDNLQHESYTFEEKLSAAKAQLTESEEEKTKLASNLEEQREKSNNLQSANEMLNAEVSRLQKQLTETLENIEFSKSRIKELEENESLLDKQFFDIQKTLQDLTASYCDLQQDKQLICEKLSETEETMMNRTEENALLSSRLRDKEETCESLKKDNANLVLKNENLQEKFQDSVNFLEMNKMEVKKLTSMQNSLKAQLDESQNAFNALKKDFEQTQECNQRLNNGLKDKETELLQSEELRCRFKNKNEELSALVEELQKELLHSHDKINIYKEDLQRLTDEETALKIKLAETESISTILRKDFQKIEQEKQALIEELRENRNLYKNLEQEKITMASEIIESEDRHNSLCDSLKKEVCDLQQQLTETCNSIKLSEEETNELRKIKTTLEARLEQHLVAAKELGTEFEKLKLENHDLNERLKKSHENVASLTEEKEVFLQELDNLKRNNEYLKDQINNLTGKLTSALNNSEYLEVQLKDAKERNSELQTLLNCNNNLLENLQCEFKEIKIHYQESQEECDLLITERTEIENRLHELEVLHGDLERKLNTLDEYSEDQKRQIEDLSVDNTCISRSLEESEGKVLKLEEEKAILLTRIQDLQASNEESVDSVQNLERTLLEEKKNVANGKRMQDTLEKKIVDLWASLEEVQIGKNKINDSFLNLKNENKVLKSKLQDSEAKSLNSEKQFSDVQKVKRELEINVETLKTEMNRLNCCFKESEVLRNKNENEKEVLKTTLKVLEGKIHDLQEKNETLLVQNCSLEKHIEELKTECAEVDCVYQKYKANVQELTREKEKIQNLLTDENESLISQLTDLKLKSNQILTENEKYKESIKEKNKRESALIDEKNVLTENISQLEQNYRGLRHKNEELILENQSVHRETSDLRKFSEQIEKELQNARESLKILAAEKKDLKMNMKKCCEENENLRTVNEEFKRQLSVLERDHKEQRDNKVIIEKKLNEVSSLSETLKVESEEVRLQYQKCRNELENFREETTKLKNENENLSSVLQKANVRNKELEEEMSEVRSSLEMNKQKIILMEQIEIEVKGALSQLENNNKTLASETEKLKRQIIDSENNSKQNRYVLETKIAELTSLATDYKNELEKTIEQNEDLKAKQIETEELLNKLRNENQMLISNNEILHQNVAEIESESKESRVSLEEEVSNLTSAIADCKNELDNALKRANEAQQTCELSRNEVLIVSQKLEQLSEQNSVLEKKLEVEEIIASQNQERVKSLEETIQDYEITISGLKSVVDTNLERIEVVNEELLRKKGEEVDTIKLIHALLKDSNMICDEEGQGDFKTFISDNVMKILRVKSEEEKRINQLELDIRVLKAKNEEMVEKLKLLVGGCDTVASFDTVYSKIENVFQSKEELFESVKRAENEKLEMNKRIEELTSEKDEINKVKFELETNLKEEKKKTEKLSKEVENKTKPDKENILSVSTKLNKSREEELKKENMALKRKLVLADNAKNNLEKVLKELRDEKKKAVPTSPSNDSLYKKLLQEYIQVREDHERVVKEKDEKIQILSREFEQMKINNIPIKVEDEKKLVQDLHNIREAYGNIMSVNSKLELEIVTLRKLIEERNSEMGNLSHIKEAYEKLLEENNRLMTEIDTVKYKRMRDKEDIVHSRKKEREESVNREMKKIQEIRNEYEGKLEKMKEKMLKLYREEVNKKVKSVKDGQSETAQLLKAVATLKSELFEADQKIQLLEMEKEILKANRKLEVETRSIQLQATSSVTSVITNDERATSLPRPTITKEITISQRTSIGGIPNCIVPQNLQMEDEDDLFNEKYLTDLKEGRCGQSIERDSVSRFSELAWRNSMVPPHLKSSYPAELQFISPSRFKDEDIKSGNVEFEDSLCKLLPGEKPRKKDFGTTSYKRPGPPTPSKNGGRLSLQGNEVHPMREHCETKTPKKSTPSRIRALFSGRNSSTRDGSESQNNSTPSRGRRLGIFRRPR